MPNSSNPHRAHPTQGGPAATTAGTAMQHETDRSDPARDTAFIIERTRRWIDRVVLDLNLCPFARRELDGGHVRFAVTRARTPERLLTDLLRELRLLQHDETIATAFLIHPGALQDFLAYNDFLDDVDRLLQSERLEGVFQVASFHPDYRFAGTAAEDAENFSNRSPWPMLHLLREDSVAAAVAQHPDAEAIPERNIAMLRRIGSDALRARLRDCLDVDPSSPT
jgi:hypothetical protein